MHFSLRLYLCILFKPNLQGGSSNKVVDCILCLKGYHEWKLAGGIGVWRYGGTVKITSSTRGCWPSPLLSCANADERDSLLQYDQRLVEVAHVLSEDLLEQSQAPSALSSLFDQFGLQLLKAILAECAGIDNLFFSSTVGKILNPFCQAFTFLSVQFSYS